MQDESENGPEITLFEKIVMRELGDSVCFFCGIALDNENVSREHVFPKWLLHRFDLWDRQLVLLNGTDIPYRQLTVPCCKTCNGVHLSDIEQRVQRATAHGFDAVSELPVETLYLWLSKIFYGLLYKEQFLDSDVTQPNSPPIVGEELLRQFSTHHFFLQAARFPIKFETLFPASLFVFRVEAGDPTGDFDFMDSFTSMTIAVRIGDVGVVAALQDGGAQREGWGEHYARLSDVQLSGIQFRELWCRVHYTGTKLNRTPKYIMFEQDTGVTVVQSPLQGLTTRSIFDPIDPEEFARVISHFCDVPLEDIWAPPNHIQSWLAPLEESLGI